MSEEKFPEEKEKNTNPKTSASLIEYEIPVEGSLGLLALGAVGLHAWRKKRDEHKAKQQNKQSNSNE